MPPAVEVQTKTPATIFTPDTVKHLYLMFYRHGMNANLTKGFFCLGDLLTARKRAETHCKIMGYKFIFVRPMVCDLESEEAYKLGASEGTIVP
jgi:hypothetical protein